MEILSDIKSINTLRLLSVDMVENAKSGHPGMPLGCASILFVLFKKFLRFNPNDPNWFNRDRFILSNGHGCALLYSILHLCGYNISLEDLKKFRQLGSITPGHPERNHTPGVEVTTGPLGQGFSNGVGMALASKHLAERFNKLDFNIINNKIYVMCGDGCLMEGITNESASLAGHLNLNNLIVLYDDNSITIDGSTDLSFTEDTKKKYEALGWNVYSVKKADSDLLEIESVLTKSLYSDKPVLIMFETKIGFGSDKEGSEKSHGAPLGPSSVKNLKRKFSFNEDEKFIITDDIKTYFKYFVNQKINYYNTWNNLLNLYGKIHPKEYNELNDIINNNIPDFRTTLQSLTFDKPLATRQISGQILKILSENMIQLIGGSADLSPSNNTKIDDGIQKGSYSRRYIHYGIREHAMCGIANGLSTYGLVPYVGTFLVFINYCLASIRLSALSKHQVIYVLTHDSIALGEDGPTHQPVESLTILRSIPNCFVFRPADGNEVIGSYLKSIENKNSPSCICLSRQSLPQLENSSVEGVFKGGYIVEESNLLNKNLDLILIATGSEVSLCIDVVNEIKNKLNVRVVSMPCVELFNSQNSEYKNDILPDNVLKISVEAGVTDLWYKYADKCIGIDTYGASGKGIEVMDYYCFSVKKILLEINEYI